MNPLQMATTDELIDELRERYIACVFVGERDAVSDGNAETMICYKGSIGYALGLVEIAGMRISSRLEFLDPEAGGE